jgi:DNA mismatch repair protein MSH5
VGVLVWLAHCGCFIPAHKAVMGLVDAILTRIASLESVATQQSTFAIDLSQVCSVSVAQPAS